MTVEVMTANQFVDEDYIDMYEVFNYLVSTRTIIRVDGGACIAKVNLRDKLHMNLPVNGDFMVFSLQLSFAGDFGDFVFADSIEEALEWAKTM